MNCSFMKGLSKYGISFRIVLLAIAQILFSSYSLCAPCQTLSKLRLRPNKEHRIKGNLSLRGDTLRLPENSTLVFKGGCISDGVIIGDKSRIKGDKHVILKNVELLGTWNNSCVYSEWFEFKQDKGFDNRKNFSNLMALCLGENQTHVYMQEGEFWTSVTFNGYGISIPSNTYFHSKATIRELPNDFSYSSLVSIKKQNNVIIDGGKYYGDVETHTGDKGEWSHGIKCEGSKDIIIRNVECNDFWGDGIDIVDAYDEKRKPTLICYNVTVDSVRCFYNRRQGISIEAVIGCVVSNSEFSYTGTKKYTRPADGIDIEAWNKYGEKLRDITIKSCIMRGNKGKSISIFANGPWLKDYELYKNNILIDGCTMDDVFVTCSYGIEYRNCTMNSVMHQYVTDLIYTDCFVEGEKIAKRITNRWK